MGSGNNSLTTVGTPTLNFTAGIVNIYGRLTLTLGTTTINGATINIDPQSTNNLGATSNTFEISGSANVTFSSGSITLVDPNAAATSGRDLKIGSTVGTVDLSGGTIYFGDGSSASTSSTVDGYQISNNTTTLVPLGNIVVRGGGGAGRNVRFASSVIIGGTLTLTSGTLTVGANTLTLQNPIAGTAANLVADNTSSIAIGGLVGGINIPSNVTALNNLTINNSNGTTLQASLLVSGTLTLTSGTITTTPTNLLTLVGDAATVGYGGATSFVEGPMAYLFTTAGLKSDKYFPIGKDGIWRPLKLTLNQTDLTPSTYTAEMFNFAPNLNATPVGLSMVSGIRYHRISETGAGGGSAFTAGSLERFWGNDDNVTDNVYIRIAQGPEAGGGTWVNLGGTGTGDQTSGNITVPFTDLTINTNFILANATGGANVLPVELSSFTAASSNGAIVLSWKTAVEIKNHGFDVERSADNKTWTKLTFIQGHGNSNSPENYSYTDNTVGKAGKYYYRLKQLDNDGGYKYSSVAEAEFVVPDVYSLSQNYPNPFNPSTKINYSLPSDSRVTLDIYNILGVKVGQLVNQDQSAGYYSVAFSTSSLNKSITSGVYLYKMTAVDKATGNSFSAIKKMMMLK
jgi:hypothetical protein